MHFKKKYFSVICDIYFRQLVLQREVMAEKGAEGSAKPLLTAAEKQLLRRREELDYWKKNAARLRSRNLRTGLAIGAFVVGMCILHRFPTQIDVISCDSKDFNRFLHSGARRIQEKIKIKSTVAGLTKKAINLFEHIRQVLNVRLSLNHRLIFFKCMKSKICNLIYSR